MEITNKSQQKIAEDIVRQFNNNKATCIKDIIHNISKEFIHVIYNGQYALSTLKSSQIKQNDFFVVVQYCLFILLLYKKGLIIIDKSIKNEPCNDYSKKEDYDHFSFNETCGDDDLGNFVCNNWNLPIIPTTDLKELVNDEFKTSEQKRFECQRCLTYLSIIVAIIIGVLSPILTKCISEKSEQEKIRLILTAIEEHKTVSIDSIGRILTDTFNVKIIQPQSKNIEVNKSSKLENLNNNVQSSTKYTY